MQTREMIINGIWNPFANANGIKHSGKKKDFTKIMETIFGFKNAFQSKNIFHIFFTA